MAVLEVRDLRKNFGNLEVLKGISFSLEKGESVAVIGSSGCGKTTLLRCLNFLERADSGTISVNGKTVFDGAQKVRLSDKEQRSRQLHFGMVFQSFNLFPQYTALENVTLASRMLAKEQPDFKQNKKQILEQITEQGKALLECGPERQTGLSSPSALRRPAAARGHCPRTGAEAGHSLL